MQNEAVFTNENVLLETNLGTKTENIETLINLSGKDVSKILSVSACLFVDGTEILLGEITYGGNLQLNVVYLTNAGNVENLQTSTPISSKYENALLNLNSAVKIVPNIVSNEIENLSPENIKVKTLAELLFNQAQNQDINIYLGGQDNVFVNQSELPLSNFAGKNCTEFSESINFESKTPIDSVVSVISSAIIKSAETLNNVVVLEGEIYAKIIAKTKDDPFKLITLSGFSSFKEEIEDGNVNSNQIINTTIKVNCPGVTTTLSEDFTSVDVFVPVKVCYNLYETKNVQIVTDAYSTTNEIALTTAGFNSTEILKSDIFNIKIDGNISLNEDLPRIDKVLAVDGEYITFTNVSHFNKELLIEGILHANILYLNDNNNNINSVNVEIPFSQKENTDISGDNISVCITALLYDVDAVVKRGRDVYIDAKMKVLANFAKTTSNAIISNVEIGEEIESNTTSIEIYFAKEGQTMWDIAKDLKVSKELLLKQNENLPEIMTGNEKVIFFNEKTINID